MGTSLNIPIHSVETEPRIPLVGVTWDEYETMIAAVGNRPRLRLSYLEGTLEIIDKMAIYAGLGVQEVWVWQAGAMTVQRLRSDGAGYEAAVRSELLPELDLDLTDFSMVSFP